MCRIYASCLGAGHRIDEIMRAVNTYGDRGDLKHVQRRDLNDVRRLAIAE